MRIRLPAERGGGAGEELGVRCDLSVDLEADNDLERKQFRDQFLRDVRDRVKELATRGYLDAHDVTVDCLLMFIPNEQVYGFVQEHDRAILDDALKRKIVVCSPLTLYAVLAVVFLAVPLVPGWRESEIGRLREHQAWAWLYGVNV